MCVCVRVLANSIIMHGTLMNRLEEVTYNFDQQTDVVTLDRPAVHGGTGVDPLHN